MLALEESESAIKYVHSGKYFRYSPLEGKGRFEENAGKDELEECCGEPTLLPLLCGVLLGLGPRPEEAVARIPPTPAVAPATWKSRY